MKSNILANYASQIYVTLIGIVLVPLYIRYMGAEAYGLIGFFAMLQAWFNLLDLGLTPTIARESARCNGGAISALEFRRIYRALSVIFGVIAILGGSILWLLAKVIAQRWLNVEALQPQEVVFSVQIMAISVALRWMCGLYRGVVTGAERLVWLSGFAALIATLRFVVVLGSMWLWGFTPRVFFLHQFAVSVFELVGLLVMARALLPSVRNAGESIGWSYRAVRPLLKFALTIAFTSSVWVLVTQTDKLVLSGILPLAEYGYFTLAVLVASGITVVSGPISSAILPRLARLHAEGKYDELIAVYRQATQWVTVIAGSAAITLFFCAEPLLYAWSSDGALAKQAAPILQLYAIGNGLLVVAAFPFYLQYAKGNLRYHLIGNVGTVVILIPAVIYAASQFGGVGAGYVWLGMNGLYLLAWLAYVHQKLVPNLHWKWLRQDVVSIFLPAVAIACIFALLPFPTNTRSWALITTVLTGIVCLIGSALASASLRDWLLLRCFSVEKPH